MYLLKLVPTVIIDINHYNDSFICGLTGKQNIIGTLYERAFTFNFA